MNLQGKKQKRRILALSVLAFSVSAGGGKKEGKNIFHWENGKKIFLYVNTIVEYIFHGERMSLNKKC